MNFKDALFDIEQLIGKELKSINPKTPSIYIHDIDRVLGKYFVYCGNESKIAARSLRELEDIWRELSIKGFSNVDQALYGGGSSRNQPETIFAHLPYIQHFKYKNRKHLLLRSKPVHEMGLLSELQSSDIRIIRKKIDNYTNLSHQSISDAQESILNTLKNSFDALVKKYPGDILVENTEGALKHLFELNQVISGSIVTLDTALEHHSIKEEYLDETDQSIDDLIDDESLTGIANTKEPEEDSNLSVATGKTKIRQLTPVVSLIYDRLSFGEIELQPDFQRKDRVWPEHRKSKLIESMLMGLPLPVFYFAEKPSGDWIIVDGLQRITTIYDFMRGEYKLEKLDVLSDFNGRSFSTLGRTEQRKIREYPLTAHLIDMSTDKDNIIVELFHRINTYGVKLSEQEIRSALNQGTSVKFLRFLAASPEFKAVTQRKVKSDRQKDMELCLSAISFMLQGYAVFDNQYNKYLSDAMGLMNTNELHLDNQDMLDEGGAQISATQNSFYHTLAERFVSGLVIANQVFGEYAFKKIPQTARTIPISKPLFELIVTYFSHFTPAQTARVIDCSDALIDKLYEAIDKDSDVYADWESDKYSQNGRGFEYAISTSTGKKVTVRYRFEAFREILKQSTDVDVELKPFIGEPASD